MENKLTKEKILIITIILAVSIVFIGIGYAFFSFQIINPKGSTAQIISGTGRMFITYNDGTDNIVPATNIQPSNTILVNKTFTLTGSNTTVGMKPGDGLEVPYKVGVRYISTFSDGMMHYYIKEVNRPANSQVTANYVITPEPGKIEDDYKNQIVPGNDTYTGYTHGTFKNGKKYTEMVTGIFPALKTEQTIKFNLIIQFPDNNENQDSEKGKTFNGKVVVNYEPPKATTFANDSWETIAAVVKDEQLEAYPVGSEKEVKIGGKNYTVRVANNTTPKECTTNEDFSQTACGFVVEFEDTVRFIQMNNSNTNKGGWPASVARAYANGSFFNNLPKDLRNVIIDTKVISGHGNTTGEENFPSTDKIYLLSGKEVEDSNWNDTAYDKTRQLDYYANYSGAIKKNIYGNAVKWWLRGANSNDNDYFHCVSSQGYGSIERADTDIFFAPAFRIG